MSSTPPAPDRARPWRRRLWRIGLRVLKSGAVGVLFGLACALLPARLEAARVLCHVFASLFGSP